MHDSAKILYGAAAVVGVFAVLLFFSKPPSTQTPEVPLEFPIGTRYALGGFFRFAVPPEYDFQHDAGFIRVSNAAPESEVLGDGEFDITVTYGKNTAAPAVEPFEEQYGPIEDAGMLRREAVAGGFEKDGVMTVAELYRFEDGLTAVQVVISSTSIAGYMAARDLLIDGWLWAPGY